MSQSTTSHDEGNGVAAKAGSAAHEASATAKTAGEAAHGVAETGAHEAAAVASEAKAQLGDLVAQSGRELSDQASTQQQRLAEGLNSMGSDLSRMADADENGGMAGDLVRRAAGHVSTIGSWLGDRDPQQVLKDVSSFARRRPGTFIAVAAIAGVVVGRLSRAIAAGATSASPASSGSSQPRGPLYAEADAAVRDAATPVPTPVPTTAPAFPGGTPGGMPAADLDSPLYTESAARLDGTREEGSHDRPDTL